jgi:hypothetical protein
MLGGLDALLQVYELLGKPPWHACQLYPTSR